MHRVLEIETENVYGIHVVTLSGSLDTDNVGMFKTTMEPLCTEPGARVLMDCSLLGYVNSACFGLLNKYNSQCKSSQGMMGFCGIPKKILGIMKILGLEHTLNIYKTREQALDALKKG